MVRFRRPGPVCQIKYLFDAIDEGTLVRARTASPSTVSSPASGSTASGGTTQPATPVVATGDCAYLNPRASGTVQASQQAFNRLRNNSGAASISQPQSIASHTWRDGTSSAAVEQTITIDNQTITVIRPTDADARGKNLPTTSQIAEALRAIPAAQRAHTNKVLVSPRAHPNSTSTRTVAGEGGSGEIELFPVNSAQTQNDFDNRIMHESGHNYQGHLWKSAQAVQDWGTAAAADPRRPSPYAANNTGDDFCEFHILFNAAKGTPCEATARQIYPNRWAKMLTY